MDNFLVTGASSGIGRAAALELDKLGHTVFAAVRKEEDVKILEQASSDRLMSIILDLTDEFSIMSVKEEIDKKVGTFGLKGLVNNAGITIPGPLEFIPMDIIREVFEVNLFGAIALTKALLPLLRRGDGRIVNVGYGGSSLPAPLMSTIASSKAAFKSFNDSLRLELQGIGIKVIMITPGAVQTPGIDKAETEAKKILKALSSYAQKLYGQSMRYSYSRIFDDKRKGLKSSAVGYLIVNALTSPFPKNNYIIGREAKLERFLRRFAPDSIIDMIAKSMHYLESSFDSFTDSSAFTSDSQEPENVESINQK
ncbi:MAG: SDR family NAD(P)-dependent oxidoreductase [candidate division Zixibacteria bacterium]|nr:SDR family NAD(P)-dependent oxidoreductase [candidate division Zixibacteria bacterium]